MATVWRGAERTHTRGSSRSVGLHARTSVAWKRLASRQQVTVRSRVVSHPLYGELGPWVSALRLFGVCRVSVSHDSTRGICSQRIGAAEHYPHRAPSRAGSKRGRIPGTGKPACQSLSFHPYIHSWCRMQQLFTCWCTISLDTFCTIGVCMAYATLLPHSTGTSPARGLRERKPRKPLVSACVRREISCLSGEYGKRRRDGIQRSYSEREGDSMKSARHGLKEGDTVKHSESGALGTVTETRRNKVRVLFPIRKYAWLYASEVERVGSATILSGKNAGERGAGL